MPSATLQADGSAVADSSPAVKIDLDNELVRWRYGCAHGHRDWNPTNGGVWCATCARNPGIEDPHHYELLDLKTRESIPWSSVELVE